MTRVVKVVSEASRVIVAVLFPEIEVETEVPSSNVAVAVMSEVRVRTDGNVVGDGDASLCSLEVCDGPVSVCGSPRRLETEFMTEPSKMPMLVVDAGSTMVDSVP